MKIVLQRINYCNLSVDDKLISSCKFGLLATVGVHRDDTEEDVKYLAKKICSLRMFKDENNKINKNVIDVDGDVMVVSNFTLMGELGSGTRPNFSKCAQPEIADKLYKMLADKIREGGVKNVSLGWFGHHMHLDTCLDGPFNIILESKKHES